MRAKRYIETSDYGTMVKRMIRAYVKRVGGGEDLEQLAGLADLQRTVNEAVQLAAVQLHQSGHSWTEIARVLGVSRQAARQRFEGK